MKKRPFLQAFIQMHSGSGEMKKFKEKKAQMAEHLKDKKLPNRIRKINHKTLSCIRTPHVCAHIACSGEGGSIAKTDRF